MANRQIYLDNSATTPILKEALDAYVEASLKHYGNPSSLHAVGVDAEHTVSEARSEILKSLYTARGRIIFTASGSEANNLAIIGRAHAKDRFRSGAKIITTDSEHPSVQRAVDALQKEGYRVALVPTRGGSLDISALESELTQDTVLVSLMLVNNETGAVYNIPEAARVIKSRSPSAYIHVDATQGYLKIPFSPEGLGADMVTVSAHKIGGPKGIGALYISERVLTEKGLSPTVFGGGQELGLRSGTENVPAIAAFGVAARIGHSAIKESAQHMEELRERLLSGLRERSTLAEIDPIEPPMHAPHIVNIALPSIKSETMLHFLSSEGISVSSGSACSSNSSARSRALISYGRSDKEADSSIRISFRDSNTADDVDALLDALELGLSRLARIK